MGSQKHRLCCWIDLFTGIIPSEVAIDTYIGQIQILLAGLICRELYSPVTFCTYVILRIVWSNIYPVYNDLYAQAQGSESCSCFIQQTMLNKCCV